MVAAVDEGVGEELSKTIDGSPVDGKDDVTLPQPALVMLAALPDKPHHCTPVVGDEGDVHLFVAYAACRAAAIWLEDDFLALGQYDNGTVAEQFGSDA